MMVEGLVELTARLAQIQVVFDQGIIGNEKINGETIESKSPDKAPS